MLRAFNHFMYFVLRANDVTGDENDKIGVNFGGIWRFEPLRAW